MSWIAVLKMPESGQKNKAYYHLHGLERLKKMENAEKTFFGNVASAPLRDLYDRGLAGTSALATQLMVRYNDHVRTTWLEETLSRFFAHELKLRYERALLGECDDAKASEDAAACLKAVSQECHETFVRAHIMKVGDIAGQSSALRSKLEDSLHKWVASSRSTRKKKPTVLLDDFLLKKADELKQLVREYVRNLMIDLYTSEVARRLSAEKEVFAPIRVKSTTATHWEKDDGSLVEALFDTDQASSLQQAYSEYVDLSRLTNTTSMTDDTNMVMVELRKKVVRKRPVQLAHFPSYVEEVVEKVRQICDAASTKMMKEADDIIDQFVSPASPYLRYTPLPDCKHVGFSWHHYECWWDEEQKWTPFGPHTPTGAAKQSHQPNTPAQESGEAGAPHLAFAGEHSAANVLRTPKQSAANVEPPRSGSKPFIDTLLVALVRYMPSCAKLENVVADMHLSSHEEAPEVTQERQGKEAAIRHVQEVASQLVGVLDIDQQDKPLMPLVTKCREAHGLPKMQPGLSDTR